MYVKTKAIIKNITSGRAEVIFFYSLLSTLAKYVPIIIITSPIKYEIGGSCQKMSIESPAPIKGATA